MNPLLWARWAVSDLPKFSHHLDAAVRFKSLQKRLAKLNMADERRRSVEFLTQHTGENVQGFLEEYRRSEFAAELERRMAELTHLKPARLSWVAPLFDCETVYLAVRAAKPKVAAETGMLYGGFTAVILQAMQDNGFGELHSFDLPDDTPGAPGKDFLVPPRLRDRRQPLIGDVRETLPPVLRRLGKLNFYIHDTRQSFDQLSWELLSAHRVMAPGGFLGSHFVASTPYVPCPFGTIVEPLGYAWEVVRNFGIAIGRKD